MCRYILIHIYIMVLQRFDNLLSTEACLEMQYQGSKSSDSNPAQTKNIIGSQSPSIQNWIEVCLEQTVTTAPHGLSESLSLSKAPISIHPCFHHNELLMGQHARVIHGVGHQVLH